MSPRCALQETRLDMITPDGHDAYTRAAIYFD
jgi:hypothetical protein